MGADLYIRALFESNYEKWKQEFEKAVAKRSALAEGTPEFEKAQQQVEYYYERMYGQGYFRDSYNNSNLLWQFDLSWWEDIVPMLDSQGRLSVAKVKQVLEMLKEREVTFEQNVGELERGQQQYFRAKYGQLRAFLAQAVEAGVPIDCSL